MAIVEIAAEGFDWEAATGPAAQLQQITKAATAHDGVFTLNEQAVLGLRHRGLQDARLWMSDVGFALLREGRMLDLVVHPEFRGSGVATELLTSVAQQADQVEAWSHCDHPGAAALAARWGVPRMRELLVMERDITTAVSPVSVPDDVVVRTFQPEDEAALLDVNAAAFAHHPEQGEMSSADFHQRMGADWWDPAGLFVAVPKDPDAGPAVLGFHWTKVHHDGAEPHGEVYVVAVNPRMAGRGLGTLLTNVGLAHLQAQGLRRVFLYVEGDNDPAIAVYTKQGFAVTRTEAQYVGQLRPPSR